MAGSWKSVGVPDYSWIWFELEGGGLGVIECGWALPESWVHAEPPAGWGGFGDVRMDVTGTEGVLSLNFNPMNLWIVRKDQGYMFSDNRHWPDRQRPAWRLCPAGDGALLFVRCAGQAAFDRWARGQAVAGDRGRRRTFGGGRRGSRCCCPSSVWVSRRVTAAA